MGRPAKAPTATIRLPVAILNAIQQWAQSQDDRPSRAEAAGRLIRQALKRRRTGKD